MSKKNVSVSGITTGQAKTIKYAYDHKMELTIPLNDFDMHIFFKNDMPCLTLHAKYYNIAMYDFVMFSVGDKRKYDLMLFKSRDKKSNMSLTLFVRKD